MLTATVQVADSLQRGLDQFIGFLPQLIGFLVILLIGWLIARAVKALLVKALHGLGIDRALSGGAAGPFVARAMPGARPSEVIGTRLGGREVAARMLEEAYVDGRRRREEVRRFRRDPGLQSQTPTARS